MYESSTWMRDFFEKCLEEEYQRFSLIKYLDGFYFVPEKSSTY